MGKIQHPYVWLFCGFAALGACLYGYDPYLCATESFPSSNKVVDMMASISTGSLPSVSFSPSLVAPTTTLTIGRCLSRAFR